MKLVQIPTVNETAVQYAKQLLERCESGEVVAVTAVEEVAGGGYCLAGSSTNDRFRTMGMMMDAVIMRSREGCE